MELSVGINLDIRNSTATKNTILLHEYTKENIKHFEDLSIISEDIYVILNMMRTSFERHSTRGLLLFRTWYYDFPIEELKPKSVNLFFISCERQTTHKLQQMLHRRKDFHNSPARTYKVDRPTA
ncbi:uncharacterized protein LOC112639375 [Camponotus floridanus]|uniref:uncharacterized protein LOC112639375 n=1 Tax=Camponotus floridanus TaxID=104421 RepID=UPI00059C79B8|nr:uncharacterized protein LOC112639375 [Camponotus floridanus]